MRRASSAPLPAPPDRAYRGDWRTIGTLLPYLFAYKSRVFLALGCLLLAKLANVGVPLVLKEIVDRLTITGPQVLVLPLALLVAYGAMRLATTAFTELREFLFAKVTQRAVRTITLQVFRHLHALSLRFHLARQTGGLTRDVERGTRGISTGSYRRSSSRATTSGSSPSRWARSRSTLSTPSPSPSGGPRSGGR